METEGGRKRKRHRWHVTHTDTGTPSNQSTAPLTVHVVEDHHEVLPHIHKATRQSGHLNPDNPTITLTLTLTPKAIRDKRLPFRGNTLVHFDAHPDMLFPAEVPAEVIYEPHQLYDDISIADWILPLVYAGHVDRVVWLKPAWCKTGA